MQENLKIFLKFYSNCKDYNLIQHLLHIQYQQLIIFLNFD